MAEITIDVEMAKRLRGCASFCQSFRVGRIYELTKEDIEELDRLI